MLQPPQAPEHSHRLRTDAKPDSPIASSDALLGLATTRALRTARAPGLPPAECQAGRTPAP
eukprot:10339062-Heterocapsa_arctica.AAC.1